MTWQDVLARIAAVREAVELGDLEYAATLLVDLEAGIARLLADDELQEAA